MPRAPAPCGSCRRGAQGIPPTAFERIRNRTERRGRNDIGQRDALTPKITEPLFQPFDLVLLKVGPISRRGLVAPLARRDSRTRGVVGTIGTTRKNSCHAARRFSACNGVLARLDLLVTGLDGGNIGHGTANVDIGPTMRRALVLRGALLAFAIRCGITARWAVSLRQAVGHLGDDLLAQLLAERGARFAAEYIGREPNGHGAVGRRRGGLWIRVVRQPDYVVIWMAAGAIRPNRYRGREPGPGTLQSRAGGTSGSRRRVAPGPAGVSRRPTAPAPASPRTPHWGAPPGRSGTRQPRFPANTASGSAWPGWSPHRNSPSAPAGGVFSRIWIPAGTKEPVAASSYLAGSVLAAVEPGEAPSVAGLQPRHSMAAVEPGEAPATAPEQPGLRAVTECPGSSEAVRLAREAVGRLSRAGKSDPAGKRSPR